MTIEQPVLPTGGQLWVETLEHQLANLRAGAHVCPLYDTVAEHTRAIVPFLRAGIVAD